MATRVWRLDRDKACKSTCFFAGLVKKIALQRIQPQPYNLLSDHYIWFDLGQSDVIVVYYNKVVRVYDVKFGAFTCWSETLNDLKSHVLAVLSHIHPDKQ